MSTLASIAELALAAVPVEPEVVLALSDEPSAWMRLAGRLHPAVVHFPIALIVTAAVLEVLGWLRPRARKEGERVRAALVCLVIAAPAACLAAWFGWINADLESYGASVERTLFLHRWTGVSVAGLACLALLFGLLARIGSAAWVARSYWLALLLSVPLVSLGGYLGGELVHGEGYLLEVFRTPSPAEPGLEGTTELAAGAGAKEAPAPDPEFAAVVLPILERRCFECHGPDKKKGNLRLHGAEHVFTDEPEHWVIKPGDAAGSVLVERIGLPADDLDRMPAKGDPLTAEEIRAISDWIDRGASYAGVEVAEPAPAAVRGAPSAPAPPVAGSAEVAATEQAVAALLARGAVAMPRAADRPDMDVNFSLASPPAGDADLDLLGGLEPTLVWLNLARTKVTDEGLARLRPFTALRHVHLERTPIGDAGLAHLATLTSLEYLNLYGTKVTDDGLATLATLASLRKLYLWETGVTEEGVAMLEARRPDLTIDLGHTLVPPELPEEEHEAAAATDEEETAVDAVAILPACCAEARAAGGECAHPCCVAAAADGKICEKCAGG